MNAYLFMVLNVHAGEEPTGIGRRQRAKMASAGFTSPRAGCSRRLVIGTRCRAVDACCGGEYDVGSSLTRVGWCMCGCGCSQLHAARTSAPAAPAPAAPAPPHLGIRRTAARGIAHEPCLVNIMSLLYRYNNNNTLCHNLAWLALPEGQLAPDRQRRRRLLEGDHVCVLEAAGDAPGRRLAPRSGSSRSCGFVT